MTATDRTNPAQIAQRCADLAGRYGEAAVFITDAAVLEQLCRDALALRDLRTLLAALPDDGWQPADWDALSEAQHNARTALENR